MATLGKTHYWESESTNFRYGRLDTRILDDRAPSNGFKRKNENERSEKKEVSFLTSKKNTRIIANKDDPCKVKTSALLYEITERVNQLAQPRIRTSSLYTTENRANVNKIPEASLRILELSKPKAIYEPPSKLPGFVAPTALRALATERILELSKPKKKPKKMSSRKRKLIYAPCSPRILYLARSKNISKRGTEDKGISRHRRSERSKTVIAKLKELDYNISKERPSKNVPKERKRPRRVRSSNSDRTVITINLDYESKSRRKAKSARERRNALARCKSSKIKGQSN